MGCFQTFFTYNGATFYARLVLFEQGSFLIVIVYSCQCLIDERLLLLKDGWCQLKLLTLIYCLGVQLLLLEIDINLLFNLVTLNAIASNMLLLHVFLSTLYKFTRWFKRCYASVAHAKNVVSLFWSIISLVKHLTFQLNFLFELVHVNWHVWKIKQITLIVRFWVRFLNWIYIFRILPFHFYSFGRPYDLFWIPYVVFISESILNFVIPLRDCVSYTFINDEFKGLASFYEYVSLEAFELGVICARNSLLPRRVRELTENLNHRIGLNLFIMVSLLHLQV